MKNKELEKIDNIVNEANKKADFDLILQDAEKQIEFSDFHTFDEIRKDLVAAGLAKVKEDYTAKYVDNVIKLAFSYPDIIKLNQGLLKEQIKLLETENSQQLREDILATNNNIKNFQQQMEAMIENQKTFVKILEALSTL